MMTQKNSSILFIVNPSAGHGKCGKRWQKLYRHINFQCPYDIYYTKTPGEAEKEAKRAADLGVKTIIAVGGDGTINEVINGIGEANIPIGILPLGTGNDLAKAVGISSKMRDIELMLKHFQSLKLREVNVGKINDRLFMMAGGIGFDGNVAKIVNDNSFLKSLGSLGYVFGVWAALRSFSPMKIKLKVDNQDIQVNNGWLLAIGNGPYYGGGMKICPYADMNDDLFDLCIVSELSKWQLFRLLPKVYSGKHVTLTQYVTFLKGKNISIHCDGNAVAHADGELIDSSFLDIKLCDYKIKIATPG